MPVLTLPQARAMLLASQGLLTPPERPATQRDVLDCIRRMGVLQIDTIHVVARSPYLVLFSRLGNYDPRWLEELLAGGEIFEYWAHAACFLPKEDYPLYRRRQLERYNGSWRGEDWLENHPQAAERVRARLREAGEARSSDFERMDGIKGAWWDWKEEKIALEHMFLFGEVMVARRERFQRVYALRERLLPAWDDRDAPALEEVERAFLLRSARHLGVMKPAWAADYYRMRKTGVPQKLARLAAAGELIECQVEGWDGPAYVHPENQDLLAQALAGQLIPTRSELLSPFDPLTWDRARARDLFGFDYTIECYLPAEKRRFGYFSLPLLRRGELVGRVAAKAHRKEKIFEVRGLFLEENVQPDEALLADLADALARCAEWHATPYVRVTHCEPAWAAGLAGYLPHRAD